MTQLSRKDLVLLALLTLFWGLNWPVMKIGVREFPPLTFRTISMVGGLAVIWLAARAQGASLAIPAGRDCERCALRACRQPDHGQPTHHADRAKCQWREFAYTDFHYGPVQSPEQGQQGQQHQIFAGKLRHGARQ